MATTTPNTLESVLEPLLGSLTPQQAEQFASFQLNQKTVNRMHELAAKNTAGTITEEERREYEGYVQGDSILSIVKVRARQILENQTGG